MILLPMLLPGAITVSRTTGFVAVDNGQVRLRIDRRQGVYEVRFRNGPRLGAADSVVRLKSGTVLRAGAYRSHVVDDVKSVKDQLGVGESITVHNFSGRLPELRQVFRVYPERSEVFVEISVLGQESLASNYMAPVSARFNLTGGLKSHFVPYDNDNYTHYRTDSWATKLNPMGSNEVGAVFDDASRHGLIVGSISHDLWKSGVCFSRAGNVTAYAGARGPVSQRLVPHGMVSGKTLRSPQFVVGWYPDWRTGMERYGALNANIQPALPWSGGVPFGWNSWAGLKNDVRASDAYVATEFLSNELRGLRNDGTATVGLDSYWDNLNESQLVEFAKHVHERRLKAGIYWSPFTGWGELDSAIAGDARYHLRDLVLKDENGDPKPRISGGFPLDPTHPGVRARIDRQLAAFVAEGFDFIKLDFLSHGSLEGQHFDASIQTGTAAYRVGMQRIVDDLSPSKIGRSFFISLAISPLFPQGYGHSRRISCDAFANIGSTEYLMNAAGYGWWTNRTLYDFNDPDSTCVYQPRRDPVVSEAEARSRFTASVVSGGMLFDGDDLSLEEARDRVSRLFTNRAVLALARLGLAFRPIEKVGTDKSVNSLYAVDPHSGDVYVAAFNYSRKRSRRVEIPFSRLPVYGSRLRVLDLWNGAEKLVSHSVKLELAPMSCVLVSLRSRVQGLKLR